MSRRRGKRAVLVASILAVLVVGATGFFLKDLLIEEVLIRRVERFRPEEGVDSDSLEAATQPAIEKLGELGSLRALPRFLRGHRPGDPSACGCAECATGAASALIEALGARAAPAIRKALLDPEPDVRLWVAQHIDYNPLYITPRQVVSLCSLALARPGQQGRLQAAIRLGFLEEETDPEILAEAVSLLERSLGAQPELCVAAAAALADLGPRAKGALPRLEAASRHPHPRLRREALSAIGRIVPGTEAAMDAFARAWSDPDPWVRTLAIYLAMNAECPEAEKIRFLILAFEGEHDAIAWAARNGLEALASSSAKSVYDAIRGCAPETRARLERVLLNRRDIFRAFLDTDARPESGADPATRSWAAAVLRQLGG